MRFQPVMLIVIPLNKINNIHMEANIIKAIENTLNQLDKSTTWIFVTLVFILFASLQESKEFEIGKFKIKKTNSSFIFYIILCALNFQVLKYLQSLSSLIQATGLNDNIIFILQSHNWIFNPFVKTIGILTLLDYFGLPLLIIMWWLGFSLANKETVGIEGKINQRLVMFLFFVYLILGLMSLIIIQSILLTIGNYEIVFLSEFVGIILGLIIFNLYSKKYKILKRLFNGEN